MRLSYLPWLILGLTAQKRQVRGLDLRIAAPEGDANMVADRVDAAMSLIEAYDPAIAADACRRIRWLLFSEASGGSYLAGIRTIRIATAYAQRVTVLEFAMLIVHELTHAQLIDDGMKYDGSYREQAERTCVQAEIAFARLVPGSELAIARTETLLQTEWWDVGKSASRTATELVGRGFPKWLARLLVSRSQRRTRSPD